MLDSMKNDPVISEYVEVQYKQQAEELLKKLWVPMLSSEDRSLNLEEFQKLLDELVEKMYINLQLAFDNTVVLREYVEYLNTFKEEQQMVKDLTEQSTQELLPEERLLKLFNL